MMDANLATLMVEGKRLLERGSLTDAKDRFEQALRSDARSAEAHYYLAQIACREGKLAEGIRWADQAIALDGNSARTHDLRGMALARLGRHDEALASFDSAVACQPDFSGAHGNRADALVALGRRAEAIESYNRAIAIQPNSIENLLNRAATFCELGQHDRALADYSAILAIDADSFEANFSIGNILVQLGRHGEAIAAYDAVIAVRPSTDACVAKGEALRHLARAEDALASFGNALSHDPRHVGALMGRAAILIDSHRPADALAAIDVAVAAEPRSADAHNIRSYVLRVLNRHDEAVASAGRALAIDPQHIEAINNHGAALTELGRSEEALQSYEKALAIDPGHFSARQNLATALQNTGRLDRAIAEYGKLHALRPDLALPLAGAASCQRAICQWAEADAMAARVLGRARDIDPFTLMGFDCTPHQLFDSARSCLQRTVKRVADPDWSAADFPDRKLKIAYLSGDYHGHPVAYLIAELFEIHDRSRFEIIGVSNGPEDGREIRARIKRGFDRFLDIRSVADDVACRLIRDLKCHIVVDLSGHTANGRPGLLALRPAPIQVAYLGYPGTTGASFIDYVLADPIIAPFDQQPYFSEKIVHLPGSYQVNDTKRPVASAAPTRRDLGVPDDAFVFCCFNNTSKITPSMFDVWMRILANVEGSVLWLYRSNDYAPDNLRREAQARGIDPGRLIFATRADLPAHLARLKLADLVVDTLPYNAHTTASDALWVGVPVLTCLGPTFAGRVGASLLHAVGLPELATQSIDEYEALAVKLAGDPVLMASLRQRLERNRHTAPLFNSRRTCRAIEAAYETMWDRWRAGRPPEAFVVPAGDA